MAVLMRNREIRDILESAGIEVPKTQAEAYGMEFLYNRKSTRRETRCSVCGLPITLGELQIEFLAGRVSPSARPYLHHIHRDCFLLELIRLFEEEGDNLLEAVRQTKPLTLDELIPKAMLVRLKGNGGSK
jgi:hypothetical protein